MISDLMVTAEYQGEELARMLVASLEESGLQIERYSSSLCGLYYKEYPTPVKDPNFVYKDEYIAMVKSQQAIVADMMKALSVSVSKRIKVMSRPGMGEKEMRKTGRIKWRRAASAAKRWLGLDVVKVHEAWVN